MRKYTPFLKLKVNEIGALKALPDDVSQKLRPFFDLPHQKDRTEADLALCITKAAKKLRQIADRFPIFFLDLYDIPDTLTIKSKNAFFSVATEFNGQNFIPVVGLDRSSSYISSVMKSQSNGDIKSNTLAVRLVEDDFQSYAACKADLASLVEIAKTSGFKYFILILERVMHFFISREGRLRA